jgi:hypothetical protein
MVMELLLINSLLDTPKITCIMAEEYGKVTEVLESEIQEGHRVVMRVLERLIVIVGGV